jgi:hypothetical protein
VRVLPAVGRHSYPRSTAVLSMFTLLKNIRPLDVYSLDVYVMRIKSANLETTDMCLASRG